MSYVLLTVRTRRSVEEANERLWKKLETDIIGNTFKQKFEKEDLKGIIDNIKYCLDHYNMLTIFPLEGKGSASGIDYAIIMTLLRGQIAILCNIMYWLSFRVQKGAVCDHTRQRNNFTLRNCE